MSNCLKFSEALLLLRHDLFGNNMNCVEASRDSYSSAVLKASPACFVLALLHRLSDVYTAFTHSTSSHLWLLWNWSKYPGCGALLLYKCCAAASLAAFSEACSSRNRPACRSSSLRCSAICDAM